MSESRTYRLFNAQQAQQALQTAYRDAKPLLMAEHRLEVTVKPETRSNPENALLHAMLARISQSIEWAGKRRDVECWKRLLVAAWSRAEGQALELLPAIDGQGVDVVYIKTSKLSRKQCADLIGYIDAWMAEQGIAMPAQEVEHA